MIILLPILATLVAVAQPETDAPVPAEEFEGLSAREVMREGNRRLIEGQADGALGAYDQAAKLRPDAREIAFARGLANFDLRKFDDARTAFERVAVEGTDSLATDAQYGIGVSDHMEAIDNTDNPELAISLLESAMRRYHRVLAENPDHKGAQDANFKAASVWRRIKQMQEQQQKQESEDCDKEGDDKEEGDEDKDKKKSDEKKDQDQQQKDGDKKDSDEEKSDEQKQESDPSDKQDDKKKEKQSAHQKEQKVSKEQAQRQLREMMQALRERLKARQAQIVKMPVTPVDKDW